MRLSNFIIKMIWFITLVILIFISFYLDLKDDWRIRPLIIIFRMFSILFLFVWSIGLKDTLQEILALKYKIIIEKYSVQVKYLTFWWLFILYWKIIDYDYHSYKVQNLFGATMDSGYSTDVTYNNESEAISAIKKHKQKIKENRRDWFKIPDRKKNIIKYL